MSPNARCKDLISKLVDDRISDDEVTELQSLLGNHPELRSEFVDHLLLDTLLSESLGQEPLIALVDTISEPPSDPQASTKTPSESPVTVLRGQNKPWGWLAAAAVLIVGISYFFLQGDRLALAGASQLVQAAIHTHAAAIERIYVVEVKRGPTNDKLVELPRDVRVATQGDKFWAQMRGQREWVWGRNEAGAVWMTLGPKQAVVVNAEEMGMPLRYIGDLYSLHLETLLKSFLKYYQLELSDGPADSTVIVATPRRAWSNRPLKRATIEVDRETKVIRKLLLEREVDGSNSVSTFTLVESRLADESLYRPEGHLSAPYEIFGTETQVSSRRERVMNWFGSRADRWLQSQDSKSQ
ncbi:MAG: hypothetical protein ACK6DC_24165 [Planctomycetota bacterium]